MYDNILAAIAGATIGASRYARQGYITVFTVFATGFLLSYYVGADVVNILTQYTELVISYAAVYFLLAYFGPAILDKITTVIKSFQVSRKWK